MLFSPLYIFSAFYPLYKTRNFSKPYTKKDSPIICDGITPIAIDWYYIMYTFLIWQYHEVYLYIPVHYFSQCRAVIGFNQSFRPAYRVTQEKCNHLQL